MASRRSNPPKRKPPKDAAAPSLDGRILSVRRDTVAFQDLMKDPGRAIREFALHTLTDSAEREDHCARLTTYHNPYDSVLKLSNVKRVGVALRAVRGGLPENAPPKSVGVDCGDRLLKTHPVTKPIIDAVSHGWYFDDPVFYKDLTYTLAGDMDRNVIPTRLNNPNLTLTAA